jgi:hypothetical protein
MMDSADMPRQGDLDGRGNLSERTLIEFVACFLRVCLDQVSFMSRLKDADGLDRVRLGDLDARYLRNPEAREMVGFAEALFEETDGIVPAGPGHFAALWPEALRIASNK